MSWCACVCVCVRERGEGQDRAAQVLVAERDCSEEVHHHRQRPVLPSLVPRQKPLYPTPCALHPTPYTLHPTPYTAMSCHQPSRVTAPFNHKPCERAWGREEQTEPAEGAGLVQEGATPVQEQRDQHLTGEEDREFRRRRHHSLPGGQRPGVLVNWDNGL